MEGKEEKEIKEEKEGMSVGDIFRMIFSQKWILLIVTIVITLVGTLAMQLYSAARMQYVIEFKLNMPGYSMSDGYYYPDGEPFYYSTLVNRKTLDKVKESNSMFADVDTEALANNGGISITLDLPDADYVEVIDGTFKMVATSRYFKDSDTAKEFLRDVANYPCTYLATMELKHDSNLVLYDGADDYLQQIEYLQAQMNEIRTTYSSLISSYGANFIVEDGKNLNSYLRTVNAYANSYKYGNLKQELIDGGVNADGKKVLYLLKPEENIANYKIQTKELGRELETAEFVLEKMRVNNDSESNIALIQQQAEKVQSIANKKKIIDDFIAAYETGEYVPDTSNIFKNRIEEVKAELAKFTVELEKIEPIVYSKSSNANFMKANIIDTQGGIGVVKALIISLVIGVVLAAIAAFVTGYVKRRRGEKKSVAVAPAVLPVGELAAEAAPAEELEDKEDKEE